MWENEDLATLSQRAWLSPRERPAKIAPTALVPQGVGHGFRARSELFWTTSAKPLPMNFLPFSAGLTAREVPQ